MGFTISQIVFIPIVAARMSKAPMPCLTQRRLYPQPELEEQMPAPRPRYIPLPDGFMCHNQWPSSKRIQIHRENNPAASADHFSIQYEKQSAPVYGCVPDPIRSPLAVSTASFFRANLSKSPRPRRVTRERLGSAEGCRLPH